MLRLVLLAALPILAAAAPPAYPAAWPKDRFVRWQPSWDNRTIDLRSVRVGVERKLCGRDRPASEGCADGDGYLVVSVAAAGMRPITLQGNPGAAQYVGIGALRPNGGRPSVILVSDNGGSDGCAEIDVALAGANGYRPMRLDPDKAHGTTCAVDAETLTWPKDLTGHGDAELMLRWPVFHCAFTSCAGSWNSKRFIDSVTGKDVSADPALDPIYRANMAQALYACRHNVVEAQGACAGYAFDAARLGVLYRAWPVVDAEVRRGCRVRGEHPCADVDHLPADFHAQLGEALRLYGFAVRADDQVDASASAINRRVSSIP